MTDALDAGLTAINEASKDGDQATQLAAAKCRALLRGYHAKYANAGFKTIAVEQWYESPLVDMDGEESGQFKVVGKIDWLAEKDGLTYLIDFKTSTSNIEDSFDKYWQALEVAGQPTHYDILLRLSGVQVDRIIWSVVKKPTINPKSLPEGESGLTPTGKPRTRKVDGKAVPLTQEEIDAENFGTAGEIERLGTYFGMRVNGSFSAGDTESPELYEARLACDVLSNLDKYFQRRPVYRLDSEIVRYVRDLNWVAREMNFLDTYGPEEHPRNTGNCINFNSCCEYLGVCSGKTQLTSDKFKQKDRSGKEGHLSHSRLSSYNACRRHHQIRYLMGYEPADEEREALLFGTLFHSGLEAWALAQK